MRDEAAPIRCPACGLIDPPVEQGRIWFHRTPQGDDCHANGLFLHLRRRRRTQEEFHPRELDPDPTPCALLTAPSPRTTNTGVTQ